MKRVKRSPKSASQKNALRRGFAGIDLLTLLLALALAAALALPLAANQRTVGARSEQLVCLANLRHIGRAFQLWASDHDDRNPFLLEPGDGGTRGVPAANNLWFQFAWISNQLVTPKVLACPSDTNTTRVARNFSANADGGFLNPTYRNSALSYFLSFHAFRDDPRALLGGDRNLQPNGSGSCSYAGLSFVSAFFAAQSSQVWSNAIHGLEGNILFNDGSAWTMPDTEVRKAVGDLATDVQRIHFLLPR